MNVIENEIPNLEQFSSPYFFFSNDEETRVTYVSPSITQIMGFTPDEVLGRKYSEFLDKTSTLNSDVQACRKRRFSGDGIYKGLRAVKTRDQQRKVLKIHTYAGEPDVSGRIWFSHGIAQDVTDVYFLEAELHRRLVTLQEVDSQLSERERFVLDRVVAGKLNKSIAKELLITPRAIERIRSRLVRKFEVETIAEVISKATELRILSDVIALTSDVQDSNNRTSQLLLRSQIN